MAAELPRYTDGIRDDTVRYMVQELDGDYRYGRFLYWWSANDVTFYHFELITLDYAGVLQHVEHVISSKMENRPELQAKPNHTVIALHGKEK